MALNLPQYNKFALVREMLQTPSIIGNFSTKDLKAPITSIKKTNKLFLTGEGSSRIFPAKNALYTALKNNIPLTIHTEGSRQAAELSLKGYTLFGASNSGKTKELISLFKNKKSFSKFALTENKGSPLIKLSDDSFILSCGKEDAVSASKTVIEEALFYQTLLSEFSGKKIKKNTLKKLSKKASKALTMPVDNAIISKIAKSKLLYFSGRNNGVAEEAALKTNEIIRKKSSYLEGTYAVHGIEEVMEKKETIIVIDPFKEEEGKFREVFIDSIGMDVIAVSSRKTSFPTIKIPSMPGYDGYLQLLACWNLLVEAGIKLRINLDQPVRARKIGNEHI
ncbi:sugar isomerase [Candidatus Woesearchaeota archaeon]|nr:sugar isomerase [Candidatus Woesearchaeota archaeon]